MRLRKVIKNAVPNKAVVRKYEKDNLDKPVQEVIYAQAPYRAMVSYYMQFIVKDFLYEKYPRQIEGVLRSKTVSNVFYYELGDYIIRSTPLLQGDKMIFKSGEPKKAVLPTKRKELKKIERVRGIKTIS